MARFDSESEMLQMLEEWLIEREWEVYKEVESNIGITDIVAVKNGYLWGIEGKLVCNEKVILQALGNQKFYHMNSIAVPVTPNSIYKYYMQEHGLGCLSIYLQETGDSNIEVELVPQMNEEPRALGTVTLHESQKESLAGSTKTKRITRYKITVMEVEKFLETWGHRTLDEILANVDVHWSPRSAKRNLKVMMTDWEDRKFERKWDRNRNQHVFGLKKEGGSNSPCI